MNSTLNPDLPVQVSFDADAHRAAAVVQYQRIRPKYEAFALAVREILAVALSKSGTKVASVEARAKSLESFGEKAAQSADANPQRPKYKDPLREITDLAAARVITFFLSTLRDVDAVIKAEFEVIERLDKADLLIEEERLGYQSVHYLVRLKANRTALPEYSQYLGFVAELQLRTVLQHAWAEIEHDIQYKSLQTIPVAVRRRFMALAGLLEIADREFQAVQEEDERLRVEARASVEAGRLSDVEITGDALKAYLDKKIGPDGRMAKWTYEYTARMLRQLGFVDFEQINQCVAPYDHDALSRAVDGTRQGQLSRFENMIQAALGESFVEGQWASFTNSDWWRQWRQERLDRMRAAGVLVGQFAFTRPTPASTAN